MDARPVELVNARKWKGLSVEQLADLAGVTVDDLTAIEQGDVARVSPETDLATALRAYANAVGLNPETVIRNYTKRLNVEVRAGDGSARREAFDESLQIPSSIDDGAVNVLAQFPSERGLDRGVAHPLQQQQMGAARSELLKRLYASAAIAAVIAVAIFAFRTPAHDPFRADLRARADRPASTEEQSQAAPGRSGAVSSRASEREAAAEAGDLNGRWEMTNQVQSSSYAAYRRLRLGYRLELQQHGSRITGQGQKWSENGLRIPGATQTAITLDGVVQGRHVALTFVERGHRRTSGGTFELLLTSNGQLAGTFESDAARSRGSSVAQRVSATASAH